MRYRVAAHREDWAAALELAESIARHHSEDENDCRLDEWEEEKFRCLLRLGQHDRARRFGEQQAGDATSAGTLAHVALHDGALPLAAHFAGLAGKLDPDEPMGLSARARLAELGGDVEKARDEWTRMSRIDDWHVSHEELARLALAGGDLDAAGTYVEAAIAARGHTCPWPFAARAQLRVLRGGDREGARADLEKAWALSSRRGHGTQPDVWWLRAHLAGDDAHAAALLADVEAGRISLSTADHARVARVRAALG
jgi:hypothetical protein